MAAATHFRCRCPLKSTCSKKGQNLGWHESKAEAQASLKHHLLSCENHKVSEQEAEERAMDDANIEEWVESADDRKDQPDAKRQRYDNNRSSSWRSSGSGRQRQLEDQSASASTAGMNAQDALVTLEYMSNVMTRITEKMGQAVSAIRTAATFARQAEHAFNTEANNLQLLIDQLQQMYSGNTVTIL
jgi:hypothetical protein